MTPRSSKARLRRRAAHRYELVHDDAFEWLSRRRAKTIHAVVTDPPYTLLEYMPDQLKKRANGSGGIWRLPQSYDGYTRRPAPRFTVLGPKEHAAIQAFHTKLAVALLRVLVPGGHVIIASQTLLSHLVIGSFVAAGFELRGQIARTVSTLRGGDRPKFAHSKYAELSVVPRSSWEPWLIFRKPCEGLVRDNLKKWKTGALRRPSKHVPFRDFVESGPARNPERKLADHPSLKPQGLMRKLVAAALPLRAGIILDPFAGSGSTLAAAEALRLRSIGIELNAEYIRMARLAIPKLAAFQVDEVGQTAGTKQASKKRGRRSRSLIRGAGVRRRR